MYMIGPMGRLHTGISAVPMRRTAPRNPLPQPPSKGRLHTGHVPSRAEPATLGRSRISCWVRGWAMRAECRHGPQLNPGQPMSDLGEKTTYKACPHSVTTNGVGGPRQIGHTSSPRTTLLSSFSGEGSWNTPHLPFSLASSLACGLAKGRRGGVGESSITIASREVLPCEVSIEGGGGVAVVEEAVSSCCNLARRAS